MAAFVRLLLAILLTVTVTACGGGGDGGGGDGSGGLKLSDSSIAFKAVSGGVTPASQYFHLIVTNPDARYVDVRYAPDATPASWLAGGYPDPENATVFELAIIDTGLPPGTYETALRVSILNGSGKSLAHVDLPVTFQVKDFDVDKRTLGFSYLKGASALPGAANVAIIGTDPWTATVGQPWVKLDATAGSMPATLGVSVDPSALPLGTSSTTVSITDTDTSRTESVVVNCDVRLPVLSTSVASIALGGMDGFDLSSRAMTLSLETGTNAYGWEALTSASWISLNVTSGTVSGTPVTVSVDADRSGLSAGSYAGDITFSADVGGSTVTKVVHVTLAVPERELNVSRGGVGLVQTPSHAVLTANVKVSESLGTASIAWTASSDQEWLTVTESGFSGGSLTLTAEPETLGSDQMHYADVTLSSPDAVNSLHIKVGLWKGSTDPVSPWSSATSYSKVVTDPIRPYAYLHNAGSAISVLNVYTGATVATISGAGTQLGNMTVSGDGGQLFVVDRTTSQVAVVDLGTRTVTRHFAIGSGTANLKYAAPGGHGVVVVNDGHLYTTVGASAGSHLLFSPALAASSDGGHLCGINQGISPYTIHCVDLMYNTTQGAMAVTRDRSVGGSIVPGVGSNGMDVALDSSGSRIYVASGAPYAFSMFRGSDLEYLGNRAGSYYPNNVEVTPDDRLIGAVSVQQATDMWLYDDAGTLMLSTSVGATQARQLAVSGDGLRAVVLTSAPAVKMVTLP